MGQGEAGFFLTLADGGGERGFARLEFAADTIPAFGERREVAMHEEDLFTAGCKNQCNDGGVETSFGSGFVHR